MVKSILTAIVIAVCGASLCPAQMQLNGAGATFPYVIYSKWFDVYKNKTGIQFNYQSIGSGGGIKQITEGTVDFGASDGPMNDKQLEEAKGKQGSDILHIPTVMGAVVITYNVPGVNQPLKLTPAVIPDIFLGIIKKWNDPRIASLNKGVNLPDKDIVVVHRSDGSGTTFIFVDYLCKASSYWKEKVGKGTSVEWPVGIGGKGNEGVAGQVKQTEGSIGYVELAYAVKNNLAYATIQNKSGEWVVPSLESVSKAAEGALNSIPADLRASITDPEKGGYPIAGMTWLLVYENQKDCNKGKAFADFAWWAIHDGQAYAADLYYSPLPKKVIQMIEKRLELLKCDGKPLLGKH